jgi:toxin ParE1/3/4
MAKVRLTPKAEADLYGIWAAIAVENEIAADELFRRIMDRVSLAAENPLMGSLRSALSPTARILVEGRYIAIYEPQSDGVTVIAIVHGMRDLNHWLT